MRREVGRETGAGVRVSKCIQLCVVLCVSPCLFSTRRLSVLHLQCAYVHMYLCNGEVFTTRLHLLTCTWRRESSLSKERSCPCCRINSCSSSTERYCCPLFYREEEKFPDKCVSPGAGVGLKTSWRDGAQPANLFSPPLSVAMEITERVPEFPL